MHPKDLFQELKRNLVQQLFLHGYPLELLDVECSGKCSERPEMKGPSQERSIEMAKIDHVPDATDVVPKFVLFLVSVGVSIGQSASSCEMAKGFVWPHFEI